MFWTDYIKLEFDIEPFYYFTLTEHEHEQLFKNTVLCNVAVLPQLFGLFKALGYSIQSNLFQCMYYNSKLN